MLTVASLELAAQAACARRVPIILTALAASVDGEEGEGGREREKGEKGE